MSVLWTQSTEHGGISADLSLYQTLCRVKGKAAVHLSMLITFLRK